MGRNQLSYSVVKIEGILLRWSNYTEKPKKSTLLPVHLFFGFLHPDIKEWVWTVRARFKLGVELCGDHTRMISEFDDLDQFPIWRSPGNEKPFLLKHRAVGIIKLVAVTMALRDFGCPIGLLGE